MTELKEKDKMTSKDENSMPEHRPRKGLEDWEMLQTKEEPPLKIPFWVPILIVGLLLIAVLLSFPLTGVRDGYERPWFDWGLLIGVGYAVISLAVIYFVLRNKKRKAIDEKKETSDGSE